MKKIKLGTIFADRLNLNADQANLLVLKQRLKWVGFEAEILNLRSHKELADANIDFLLLGHGSIAAWAACESDWPNLANDFVEASLRVPALAINSAADRVSSVLEIKQTKLESTLSDFVVDKLDDFDLLGYKTTQSTPNSTYRANRAVITWLHGPLLAKNPALADQFLSQILGDELQGLSNANTREIDEILAGVWRLQRPLQ